ncbi:MAG: EI24 domain-containing protein [Xanthomonadaceae bacterium]|nr:EI24 domain-containing protein [Xanthomonadaceae bacterium]
MSGLTLPYRSVKLIFTRLDLVLLSLLPALVTLFLYSWIYNNQIPILIQAIQNAFLGKLTAFGSWGDWVTTVSVFLIKIFTIVIGFLTFSFMANLISIPLNDLLAQRVETALGMTDVPPYKWTHALRVIWIDAFRTVFSGMLGMLLLFLSWVPVINLVSFVGVALLYSFQYLTYPQTRRLEPLKVSLLFLVRNFSSCMGMGVSFSLLSFIPMSSAILLPIAVVSGTILFHEHRKL